MGRVAAEQRSAAGWGDALGPHPDAAKGVVGPPRKGEVWSQQRGRLSGHDTKKEGGGKGGRRKEREEEE